jgi:hypothetical protein
VVSKLIRDWKKRKHVKQRSDNLAAIAKLGFMPWRVSADFQPKRYVFLDRFGYIYDNNGQGYPSTTDMLHAVAILAKAEEAARELHVGSKISENQQVQPDDEPSEKDRLVVSTDRRPNAEIHNLGVAVDLPITSPA